MTNDLKAARERWMQYDGDEYELEAEDAFKLAHAYCELFDETPIDEEWLTQQLSIELRITDYCIAVIAKDGCGKKDALVECVIDEELPTKLLPGALVGSDFNITTRGQLRMLLLAMEVNDE